MKRLTTRLCTLAAVLALTGSGVVYGAQRSSASDHQDSALAVERAGADTTDLFVFPAVDPKNVVLVMDIHALIPRSMGGLYTFDPGVMYQFKIATDGGAKETKVIQFKAVGNAPTQRIEVYGPAAPALIGTKSRYVGTPQSLAFNSDAMLGGGMHVFAGPRKDPFFFDLAQFLKVVPDRLGDYHKLGATVPPPSDMCFRKDAKDFFVDFNVLSLVVELPRASLAGPSGALGVIHVYETTSIASADGTYEQVQRLGRPAVKEAFENFADHDTTNRSTPWADTVLANSIVTFATSKSGAGRSPQTGAVLQKVLIPDELAVDLASSGPAGYLGVETKAQNFGGRGPSTEVINPSLGAIFGDTVAKLGLAPDDHAETPCLTNDNLHPSDRGVTSGFPYVGAPI